MTVRILLLYPNYWWQCKVPATETHVAQAMVASPDASVIVSGQGWSNYDDRMTVSANLTRIMPDADAVLWYTPTGRKREFVPLREANLVNALRVMWANDYEPRVLDMIRETGTELVLAHYANSKRQYEQAGVPVVCIPHGVDERTFSRTSSTRPIPVLLTGIQSGRTYPLRAKFAQLINAGTVPGRIRPHPGYRLTSRDSVAAESEDYAHQLGEARIALVDSSVYRYALIKYIESAMSGCLVVGDLPEERHDEFREWLVVVDPDASLRDLAETINWWLNHPERAAQRAAKGQRLVLQRYTAVHRAEAIIRTIRRCLLSHQW